MRSTPSSHEVSYTGHLPNSGGLQGHSIGASYPFTVVGVLWIDSSDRAALADQQASNRPTRFIVLDTRDGRAYLRADGETFETAAFAETVALDLKAGIVGARPFIKL